MSHQGGFSLLELLCALAVLSILAHAGGAHFLRVSQDTQVKNALQQQVKHLTDALAQARQLAVLSGRPSFLCGGDECNGRWSEGFWLYQIDSATGVEKTFYRRTFEKNIEVSWRGFPTQKSHIEFQSNGLSGYQNGTFIFCSNAWQANIVLNQSGRFYVTDPQRKGEVSCQ
ncbi:prepilin-type N-terminal cleavage/methylation domain-containing protein [Marinomonas hwangdonensis]|uniref:Type II secretion system protein H n=1 Tax=Marinomonas hwangdonensis TaxID=1053647 RepID=A0A3M8QAP2_9GAMM|nr:GspH/FimT family pseudopilin [Marinomonas hwangdonensis]RNF52140.1 prepilin-type N-terminal cleavage/methylation domain-containing protein [Marinomonas hwangdonensis]